MAEELEDYKLNKKREGGFSVGRETGGSGGGLGVCSVQCTAPPV
jgi:hypothetical protein